MKQRDVELWLYEKVPVLVILYDPTTDISYFIELQSYFRQHKKMLNEVNKFVRIYIPLTNIFNTEAVQLVRQLKNGL